MRHIKIFWFWCLLNDENLEGFCGIGRLFCEPSGDILPVTNFVEIIVVSPFQDDWRSPGGIWNQALGWLKVAWWNFEPSSLTVWWLFLWGILFLGEDESSNKVSILSIFESILPVVISNDKIWDANIRFCSRCCVSWRFISANWFSICVSQMDVQGVGWMIVS